MPVNNDYSFHFFLNDIFSTTAEKTSAIVSVSMLTAPLWVDKVKPYSDIAALFAPILGCIYLSLQIGFKLWDRTRNDE